MAAELITLRISTPLIQKLIFPRVWPCTELHTTPRIRGGGGGDFRYILTISKIISSKICKGPLGGGGGAILQDVIENVDNIKY
jgi:hypothetical protein